MSPVVAPMSIRAHVDAVGAFLRAQGLKVYGDTVEDAVPQGVTGGYAFITVSAPVWSSEALCDMPDTAAVDLSVTSVGETLEQCLWVAERVQALVGVELAVPGRLAYVRSIAGGNAMTDRDVPGRVVWFALSSLTIDSLSP